MTVHQLNDFWRLGTMNLGDRLKSLPRAISAIFQHIFQHQLEQFLDVPLDVGINGL